jgi:phosphohistidine phosphatase
MDRLILFRHGKAEPDSDSGDDFDRRLAPRGETESAVMGARLAEMGFLPDIALVSPAARTRDTWRALEGAFPRTEARVADGLYHADSGLIRAAAEEAGARVGTVIVVGHNPGLQELAVALLAEAHAPPSLLDQARRRFPTATAAVFLFDANGRPSFDGLFYPERGG